MWWVVVEVCFAGCLWRGRVCEDLEEVGTMYARRVLWLYRPGNSDEGKRFVISE